VAKIKMLCDHIIACADVWDRSGVSRVRAITRTANEIKALLDPETEVFYPKNLFKKLAELDVSKRTFNVLKNRRMIYVGDVAKLSEQDVMGLENSGRRTLNEIIEVFVDLAGVSIGMDLPNWPPAAVQELSNRLFPIEPEVESFSLAEAANSLAECVKSRDGAPSMDDVLASIRRILEDESLPWPKDQP
jgi:hypothetical protein